MKCYIFKWFVDKIMACNPSAMEMGNAFISCYYKVLYEERRI